MSPARAEAARKARRIETEAVLANPPLKRIAKGRFEELKARLEEADDDPSKPKPFTLQLFEDVDAFAGRSLTVSPELRSLLNPRAEEPVYGQD